MNLTYQIENVLLLSTSFLSTARPASIDPTKRREQLSPGRRDAEGPGLGGVGIEEGRWMEEKYNLGLDADYNIIDLSDSSSGESRW